MINYGRFVYIRKLSKVLLKIKMSAQTKDMAC
jgi:hypothetical protein